MIQELVNYSEWLKKDFPDLFKGIVFEGLHIEVSLDKNGKLKENGFNFGIYQKDDIPSSFLLKLAKNENVGEMIPIYIIKNKYIDSSGKFFSSNNYYSYFFKLFKKDNTKLKLNSAFDFKPRTTQLKNNDYGEKFENYIEKYKELFSKKLKTHYNLLKNNSGGKSIIPKDVDGNFEVEKDFEHIKFFLEERFWNIFVKEKIIEHFITNTTSDLKEISKNNQELLISTIFLTFKTPYSKKNFKKQADYYYKKKLPLKPPKNNYEEKHKITGEWPNIFNPILTQDNEKKVFSRHRSHFSQINKKLHRDHVLSTLYLLKIVYHGKLPNPLPVFLNKDELNKKVVTIYKKSDSKKSYTQIIKSLIMDHGEDIQNYYIINYSKGKNLIINDVDLVSNFRFWVKIKWNQKLFELFNINRKYTRIEHVFHIEQIFRNKMFNNELRYFGDIDFLKDTPSFLKNNIYKYRKLLYSAFLKSHIHLITPTIFKDICIPIIRHEIFHDEINNKGKSKNKYRIKEKLLIYIHLNNLFGKTNGGRDMSSELPKYYDNLLCLLRGEIDYYQSDEDFAFGTGQLIRYLLKQSVSNNKNHSMLEPFLQKLGNFNVFITQINRALRTYGYKIEMHYDTFDKMMSNSTSYKLEDNKSLKDFETILISGYFAKSAVSQILEEKKEEQKRKQIEKNNEGEKND